MVDLQNNQKIFPNFLVDLQNKQSLNLFQNQYEGQVARSLEELQNKQTAFCFLKITKPGGQVQ